MLLETINVDEERFSVSNSKTGKGGRKIFANPTERPRYMKDFPSPKKTRRETSWN